VAEVQGWAVKTVIALTPILLGALVTIAWQNSHSLAVLTQGVELMRVDLERTKASLEPGRTVMLRIDHADQELAHLRELVEARLVACPPSK
jgi:hypothetical protein